MVEIVSWEESSWMRIIAAVEIGVGQQRKISGAVV
jgi:hypothetical protein